MRLVTFNQASGAHFPGDVASFPDTEASLLVKEKIAHFTTIADAAARLGNVVYKYPEGHPSAGLKMSKGEHQERLADQLTAHGFTEAQVEAHFNPPPPPAPKAEAKSEEAKPAPVDPPKPTPAA